MFITPLVTILEYILQSLGHPAGDLLTGRSAPSSYPSEVLTPSHVSFITQINYWHWALYFFFYFWLYTQPVEVSGPTMLDP